MNQELSKQTARELNDIARAINDREKTIEQLKGQTVSKANETLTEAILQGKDLLLARAQVPRGLWDEWLQVNCPALSRRSAYVYISLAKNVQRAAQITEADSIRGALALIAKKQETAVSPAQKWPAYLDGIYRFTKALSFVEKNPIESWPDAGKDKLREELKPIVAVLWPGAVV